MNEVAGTDGTAATEPETETQSSLLQLPDQVKLTLPLQAEKLLPGPSRCRPCTRRYCS